MCQNSNDKTLFSLQSYAISKTIKESPHLKTFISIICDKITVVQTLAELNTREKKEIENTYQLLAEGMPMPLEMTVTSTTEMKEYISTKRVLKKMQSEIDKFDGAVDE